MTNETNDVVEVTENVAINAILSNQEGRQEQFLNAIKGLVKDKYTLDTAIEGFKDCVKGAAEVFEVKPATLNKIINSMVKDVVDEEIEKLNTLSDLLTVVKENVEV